MSYGIKIWTDLFRFVTIQAFDGRTDGHLPRDYTTLHSMQHSKNQLA